MQRILVWDLPTRVFHWVLAASFALAWLTSESDIWLSQHVLLGYVMLGLVGFRVLWGVVGGSYARFASFAFSPKAGLAYLREVLAGRAARHIGHNPAGTQAIYLLLLLVLVVGLTGIFAQGGEEQRGAGWIGMAAGGTFKKLHEASATLMLLVVAAHVAGVVIESLLHKENLARSMLTGSKLAPPATPVSRLYPAVAVMLGLAVAAFGGWWFLYAPPFTGAKLADNAQWREECSSCHLSFHPSLLPQRSWEKLMAQQHQHFGADLGLDGATTAALLAFATDHAADKHPTEAAFKIDSSLKADAVPLRITQTPYWIKKHRDIASSDWQLPWISSQANCEACHQDAQAGSFEDAATSIPRSPPVTR